MFRRLTLAAALAVGAVHAADLPEPVARLMQAAQIPPQAAGIVVMRGDTTLISHNAQQSMQPASTMKLFTTLTALEQLGPVFRGRTELLTSAPIVNGTLQGDLILRGGADADFNEDVLGHMLQALRNQGIKSIKGDIVLDRQLFQPSRPDLGQPPFDEYPWAYYNVAPDALLVNTNLLKVEMRSVGGKLSLAMMPEMDKVGVRSEMATSDAPCPAWENGWRSPDFTRKGDRIEVVLHGSFPRDCVKSISVNVLDPHDYLERLVRTTWHKLGGTLKGDVREASAPTPPAPATAVNADTDATTAAPTAPPAAVPAPATTPVLRLLADHVARPLPEVLRDTNKNSDNTLARTIFLSLGSLEADPLLGSRPLPPDASQTSTAARAEAAIRAWLQRHAIDGNGLVIDNGSGLSRAERATPAQLAGVLRAGLKSLWMPEFLSSLPIAATDGTMRRRLKDSPAAMRARVKTGSLKGVIAVAGYVQDANNEPVVVVAMLNDEHVANGAGRAVLDALIDWVARSGTVPGDGYVPSPPSATR
ncbi:MAG TPA: D-alanyl-D-alanine carboxypeptidase/D-alanyl-D-alanine-endopeptidase [Duganella sp.]|uniref:D-alanyl-D-alanine carboxypeptidase/D-alanyl-D-alanine-endopeptidase n=1 Tax=Duganella sp. TaxID=1904440 RepID=UPI002ED36F48